jgi:hypothetical protein
MGVMKKKHRKIVRNNRVFYWHVKNGEDDDRLYLSIKSDDKKFIVSYMLEQKDTQRLFSPKTPFIIVVGKEFKGLDNLGHCWERFVVPEWEDKIVTPSLVAEIIDWCFTDEEVIPVDYKGKVLNKRRVLKEK